MQQQYFEGILQLRNPNGLVLDFVSRQTENKEGVFIAKKVKMINGWDFYYSSQKFLQNLGRKLQKTFGGELKISTKLFTQNRMTSKLVYRVNVLFRLPTVKKGDIVTLRGEDFEIIGMGHKVVAKSKETGKKVRLEYEDLP
jgi:NMD protein affecting ribosome stability and mRNA decay